MLREGVVEMFGPRDEVIAQLTRLASVKTISTAAQAKVAS